MSTRAAIGVEYANSENVLCDYSRTTCPPAVKVATCLQVELNTIAVSMGSLSSKVSALHRHLLQMYPAHAPCTVEQLPDHNPLSGYATALAAAQKAFCKRHSVAEGAAVVVFVVQAGERNAYDQHLLQQCLWMEHRVHVVRRTLHDIATFGEIDDSGTLRCIIGQLFVDCCAAVTAC
jgi:glutathione synthase